MKLFRYSLSLIFTIAAFTLSATEIEKVIEESFSINQGATLDIQNKYGDVTLIKWNKNEVHIEVKIIAEASSESKANDQIDRVTIDFSSNSNRVSAETSIEESNSWFNWNIFGQGKTKLKINYIIHAPQQLNLDFTNKYGAIHLPNYDGNVDIVLGYGKLMASNITGTLDLEMKYSKGSFGDLSDIDVELGYSDFEAISVGDADVELKYGSFEADRIGVLDIEVKYSKINIGMAQELIGEGGYNDYKIDEVGNVNLTAKYTDTDIKKIGGDCVFNLSYGNLRIIDLPDNNSTIDIESKYTGIRIDDQGAYEIDFDGRYTDLRIPSGMEADEDIKDGNNRILKGYKGGKDGPKLKVRSGYGELRLR